MDICIPAFCLVGRRVEFFSHDGTLSIRECLSTCTLSNLAPFVGASRRLLFFSFHVNGQTLLEMQGKQMFFIFYIYLTFVFFYLSQLAAFHRSPYQHFTDLPFELGMTDWRHLVLSAS
jgi:hypothetical protein